VAGNIGHPLSAAVKAIPPEGILVVEVSSFQLERIESFQPHIGAILNITPDHLDRHHTMEAYMRAKARLLMNQTTSDVAILNRDDPRAASLQREARGRVILYSVHQEISGGVFIRDGRIISQVADHEAEIMAVSQMGLLGPHNLSNSLAAVATTGIMDIDATICAQELMEFKGLEHRLELVRVMDGVKYVNDSKATNVEAVEQALLTFQEPILLIAGGRDKNGQFERLNDLIRQRVRLLLLFGEARDKMRAAWGGLVETVMVRDLAEAVQVARNSARSGDCVLLSPACASFDMFRNFEHRGNVFKQIVSQMKSIESSS
jgi:UDP-N-acetylmuramoylalanine--D-glutamate ligase